VTIPVFVILRTVHPPGGSCLTVRFPGRPRPGPSPRCAVRCAPWIVDRTGSGSTSWRGRSSAPRELLSTRGPACRHVQVLPRPEVSLAERAARRHAGLSGRLRRDTSQDGGDRAWDAPGGAGVVVGRHRVSIPRNVLRLPTGKGQ
jgi:hypothetical protein